MESVYTAIRQERQEALCIITMNRPEARNALNQTMRFELREAIEAAANDASVRVILLCGEGKGFSAGADLLERLPGCDEDGYVTEQIRNEYAPIINAITNAPKPVIAVVNGAAAGIGAAFALACDLIVMAEDAYLYSAFGAISLVPDGGMHLFLRQAIGVKKAYEMIAFSQRLDAQNCEILGIANRVVAPDALEKEAINFAMQLSQQAPLTLRFSKQLLAEAAGGDLQKIIDREAVLQNTAVRSKDFAEGSLAFMEKRPPVFSGK